MAAPKQGPAGGRRQDPLTLLRQLIKTGQKVSFQDDFLEIDGQQIHRSTKCGFRLAEGRPLLDIGSVWYMFREITGDRPYTQDSARKRGFQYIGVVSRGDLLDYLSGRVDSCHGLVTRKRKSDKLSAAADQEEIGELPAEEREAIERRAAKAARAAGKPTAAGDGGGGGGAAAALALGAKAEAELSYADVAARVRPVKDLDALVRAPGKVIPNADLILRIAQDEVSNWFRAERKLDEADATRGSMPFLQELQLLMQQDEEQRPIILVPCNKNAPVNLLTAQELLQDGKYSKIGDEHVRFFESTRPEWVSVQRNVRGHLWTFEVRDSTKGFSKNQWMRVVAMVSDGSEWQFKGWPFETIVDMFTTIKGFYFVPIGELTPIHVDQWAVTVFNMPKLQFQHKFAEVRDAFWVHVEKFLGSYRSKKFVNHTSLEGTQAHISVKKRLTAIL